MTTMTEIPATETALPAERLNPGVGRQLINIHDPRTGKFVGQRRAYGGEAWARAQAELGFVHPAVDRDRWIYLRAVALGYFPSGAELPNSRDELIAHCDTCEHCQVDDNDWDGLPTMEIADFVWASHPASDRQA